MLLVLFVASLGAELAGVEKIVGAFLAGLAVNSVLPEGKAKELEIHLQGMTAKLAEKNQEILEPRRCHNRNLSQQKLESLREPTMSGKKSRKSY